MGELKNSTEMYLDEKFKRFDDKLRAINDKLRNNDADHKLIIEQTTKTNGSVRGLQIWRGYITGGFAVLSAIILPVLIAVSIKWFSSNI